MQQGKLDELLIVVYNREGETHEKHVPFAEYDLPVAVDREERLAIADEISDCLERLLDKTVTVGIYTRD